MERQGAACLAVRTPEFRFRATENHIRRHVGDLPRDVLRDLARLLMHTKQACSCYPMAIKIPKDGRWDSGTLARLHSPKENAWFVPLGYLPAGRYRATLRQNEPMEGVCLLYTSDAADE